MKKNLLLHLRAFIAIGLFFVHHLSAGQTTTVFNDDFSTPVNTVYSITNGFITDSPTWSLTRSGADFGAGILNRLILTNDGTNGSNSNGYSLGYTSATNFLTPYSTTLVNNPGPVTWTFNMRQSRGNPAGFNASNFGTAFILAGTSGTTNVTGTGYAVVLGNPGTTDPIRLVRYTSGMRNSSPMITSGTAGLADFGTQYLSIRVVYTPSTNTWQLFVRNDGTTAFADPATGTLTSQGSVVNSNYTNTSLPIMGGYFNGGTTANQTSFFDNVRVTVGVPFITSLTPNSRIAGTGAFTLTVNGQNFSPSSIVRWNGSNRTTTYVSPTQLTVNILASDIVTSGTANVTVANGTTVSNSTIFTIDPAGVPNLTVSTASLNLATSVSGTASTASSYTISGVNLTADPVVTAPANFEVSTDNLTFSPSLTLPRSGNTIVGQPRTIYVRTTSAAPSNFYNVVVNNTAAGATAKPVNISATVLATQPSVSTAINFTAITSTSFTVNWTSGNGARRLLLIRQGGAVNSLPIDGQSYTAIAQFGSGSEIGTGNFVAYSGTGNSTTVTGLSPSTSYHVSVVDYNGSGGLENYTATGLIGNATTLATPVGWQIYTPNTVNTITFDETVDGVNTDAFQSDGLALIAETGQLSSGAWAFTGFSSGNIAFGGASAEDSDYDQGTSTGGVSEGGLYAFETQPDNFSLGIQPATGDFINGNVTLRMQNRTGLPLTTFNIGYKVYVYNDQASSSSFNMSYSTDNTTYTAATALNISSPAAADDMPQWKAYYRVITVTVPTVANNGFFYLRWNSTTLSGTGDFDEFALDDIRIIATPTSVFAPFSGTAESFVLAGNATQSADLEVVGNLTFNGGKLAIGSHTLTSNGSITNTTNQGITGSASSNLIIGGTISNSLSFDQAALGTSNLFNNFTIATTSNNATTVANPIVVNGNLNVATDQTLNMGANALTGTLTTATINGTLRTSNTTTLPLPSGKTWSGTGTVIFDAVSSPQTVVLGTYNGLTISSTGGAVAGGALTVNGILDLPTANPSSTVGSLSMGAFELLMGGNATNTGIGDVTGDVIRTSITSNVLYTFGHEHTSIIFPAIGTLPTVMGLRIQLGAAPSLLPGAILRKYDFKQTGGTGTKAIIKAHYLDSELNGNIEANLVDWACIIATSTTSEQGRSNYNTTENWVELTNVDVIFFQLNFGQRELTLDEYFSEIAIWNGSVNDSWTTINNWTPNAMPSSITTVIIPNTATLPNAPTLNPTTHVGKLNIETGGIVNAPAGSVLNVYGAGGAWINNGIFNPTVTSTVTFRNLDATIAGVTTFNNITIETGAGLRPQTGNIMHISGVFDRKGIFSPGAVENTVDFNGTNQTIPQLTTGLLAYNNLTITGSGAIFPASLNITGNLTLDNTVDFTGKTIVMTGLTTQTIAGDTSPTFNDLTIANTNGNVLLGISSTINGTLTLNSGQLIVESTVLNIGTNPVAGTFDATKMIVTGATGEVRKAFTGTGSYFFPIGENTTPAYSPIEVNITADSFSSASVGVSVKDGKHPDNHSLQNHLTRYWNVNQSGITGAVATITATYLPEDASADVTTIAAAQLSGTFNQITNPWIKFDPLSGNTLSVIGATLTSGQTSAFTGIKGEDFTVVLSGYGEFCQNQAVTLSAVTSGGDAPYAYEWSDGLGNSATATPPTNIIGTENYSVTVRDANGIVDFDSADVTVLTPSLGGTLSPSQNVCLRTEPGEITLTGHTGNVLYWQRSENSTFATDVTNISNFTDILTSENAGIILATTYFRAVISNGNCTEVFSGTTSANIQTTTWDGFTWSAGEPDGTTNAIITNDFSPATDFVACSIKVDNGADVTIPSDVTITLNGAVVIDNGTFTVNNNASLVQTDDSAQNLGDNFTMRRDTEPMYRFDYTYWSSPVSNQTLFDLSPDTLFNKYFGWNATTESWTQYPNGNHVMVPGQGYIIRAPQFHSTDPLVTQIYQGNFNGTPNNGIIRVPVVGSDAFNLLGNPYPSAINADEFLQDSENTSLDGTIYLWTHNTPIAPNGQIYSYSADDYAVYNLLGGVGTAAAPSEEFPLDLANIPTGFIAAGQGFFIQGIDDGTATFNNNMRVVGNNDQFFKNPVVNEKSRIWISISNSEGFKQQLIGYATNATNDFDRGWDGAAMTANLEFYSFIADKKLSIQSFALPFNDSQVIPIGFKTTLAGFHSINFNDNDGLLVDQEVYLKDKLLSVVHDLKASNYEFTSTVGTFDGRFEIVYVNVALENPEFTNQKGVLIYNQESTVSVKSYDQEISSIRIIDMQGRVVFTVKDVNSFQSSFELNLPNQVLIVEVLTKDGKIHNKKIVR